MLGPFLFNIYLSNLILFATESDIANYADDNFPYACKNDIESDINQLEDSRIILKWVAINALKSKSW